MKSKFDSKLTSAEQHSTDKTLEFVGLYKSAADSIRVAEKRKSDENNKDNSKNKAGTLKRERSPNKNKKKSKQELIDVSLTDSDLHTSVTQSSPNNNTKVTSTPNTSGKAQGRTTGVKSIMKNKSPIEQSSPNDSARSVSSGKPKKRNKSVSFMLDDNEEVVIKRTKSDDSLKVNKKSVNNTKNVKDKLQNLKKFNKHRQAEKENKSAQVNNQFMDVDSSKSSLQEKKANKPKKLQAEAHVATVAGDAINQSNERKDKKRMFKKVKTKKTEQSTEPTERERDTETNNNEVSIENRIKKSKKKKVKSTAVETAEVHEPGLKSSKQDKPDIAEDLENLSIGDNAHTLTNLLDEMTVVDREKRKKLRQKFNKNKKPKGTPTSSKEDSEKSEEVKEKVKWKKRKWNKDKKGDTDEDTVANTVIVENLPIFIMLNYRKLLTENFIKHGIIKKIGIAEVFPTEESKPVFTTTITFGNDGGAEQALQENNSYFEGSRIRVKRVLPATQTTVVVRSYAELTDQALCTAFHGAGKIRSIRHLVKGKKTMSTTFIEFDGPETVERAIKLVGDTKIGGKKIHIAKFEVRAKKVKKVKNDSDSAVDADSEDSND